MINLILISILLACFIGEVILTESELFGWSTILLIVAGGVCYYFNIYGAALWVKSHLPQCLEFAGVYLIIGVVWSFIKWFSYLVKYREDWQKAKNADADNKKLWIELKKEDLVSGLSFNQNVRYKNRNEDNLFAPPSNDEEWEQYYKANYPSYEKLSRKFKKPLASANKARITAWMAFWIFSMFGTIINDPIRRLFNFAFSSLKELYQKMSDKIFKDMEQTQ